MTATQPEGLNMTDELKQAGLDAHVRRLTEQKQSMKAEENVKPHGWKGNPDISPAAPAQSAKPVGSIQRDNIHGFHMEAKVPWDSLPIGTLLYASPQPSPTAVVLDDERAAIRQAAFKEAASVDAHVIAMLTTAGKVTREDVDEALAKVAALSPAHALAMSSQTMATDDERQCELCKGVGEIGIPGQRCFACDGSGKSFKDRAASPQPVEQTEPAYSWLPISSAPRDGSNILIRFGRDGASQAKYVPGVPHPWKFIDTNDGITWLINGARDDEYGPSHWMPMPSVHEPEPGNSTVAQPVEQTRALTGEPVAWFTDDHLTDKSATTWDRETAERWKVKGWTVKALYAARPASGETE
jgi:hypothetical protein